MAFAGMFIALIFIIIAAVIYLIALIELIIGIVLLCKKKKVPGIILIVLSVIPAIVTAIGLGVYFYNINHPEFETYDGRTVTINMKYVNRMEDLLREHDMDGLDALLDKHPELIYYQDINHTTILEYGVKSCDVEVMEIAYDHGARFDEPTVFDGLIYDASLEHFADEAYWVFLYSRGDDFESRFTMGVATDDMIEAARFAVDHGASTVWEHYGSPWTFADHMRSWVWEDGEVSRKDRDMLRYANSVSGT